MSKLAIVITTYQRPDGRTPFYLKRTLDCIERQTYQDYEVYLIGDAYKNQSELEAIVFGYSNIKCLNLPRSVERERYRMGTMELWCCGGVTAANKGIEMALNDGYQYICHQAHDDTWEPNHLEIINRMVEKYEPIFCCTLSSYFGRTVLPGLPETHEVLEFYPIDGGMIASVACVKYSDTKIRVMDRLHVEGIRSPADAYLWEQLRNEMKALGKKGYITTTITGHHDEEGSVMRMR